MFKACLEPRSMRKTRWSITASWHLILSNVSLTYACYWRLLPAWAASWILHAATHKHLRQRSGTCFFHRTLGFASVVSGQLVDWFCLQLLQAFGIYLVHGGGQLVVIDNTVLLTWCGFACRCCSAIMWPRLHLFWQVYLHMWHYPLQKAALQRNLLYQMWMLVSRVFLQKTLRFEMIVGTRLVRFLSRSH